MKKELNIYFVFCILSIGFLSATEPFCSEVRKKSFDTLPLSFQEEHIIDEIIHTMATHGLTRLLFKKKSLESMGKEIEQVHPLKFLHHILSSPMLKTDLCHIRKSFFKWNGFMEGFKRRMTEEISKNNVEKYLSDFCIDLDFERELIDPFILKKDWEGFIKILINKSDIKQLNK